MLDAATLTKMRWIKITRIQGGESPAAIATKVRGFSRSDVYL